MAIIKCPECGKEISEHAKSCMYCGYPLEETIPTISTQSSNIQSKKADLKSYSSAAKALSIVAVLIVIFAAFLLLKPKTNIVGMWETTVDELILRQEFRENGEFHSTAIMNGFQVPGGDGTYTVNGNEIIISMSNGNQTTSEFSIKDGKLNLDGFIWEKVN